MVESQSIADGMRPAGVRRRLAGYAVDLVIVAVAAWLVLEVVGLLGSADASRLPAALDTAEAVALAVLAALVSGAYFAGCWAGRGATIGQGTASLTVTDRGGHRLSGSRALVRWAAMGHPAGVLLGATIELPLLFLAILIVLAAWPLVLVVSVVRSPDRRGIHDRLAGSMVVTRRGRRADALRP